MVRFLLQALLLCVVLIAAWRMGGKPERYVATTYFIMLLTAGLHAVWAPPSSPHHVDAFFQFRAWLDLAALCAVVVVALRYDRWWTLWVGSAQFLAVMAHVLRALEMPIPMVAFAVMERWPVWLAILLTGLGTILHHHRATANRNGT